MSGHSLVDGFLVPTASPRPGRGSGNNEASTVRRFSARPSGGDDAVRTTTEYFGQLRPESATSQTASTQNAIGDAAATTLTTALLNSGGGEFGKDEKATTTQKSGFGAVVGTHQEPSSANEVLTVVEGAPVAPSPPPPPPATSSSATNDVDGGDSNSIFSDRSSTSRPERNVDIADGGNVFHDGFIVASRTTRRAPADDLPSSTPAMESPTTPGPDSSDGSDAVQATTVCHSCDAAQKFVETTVSTESEGDLAGGGSESVLLVPGDEGYEWQHHTTFDGPLVTWSPTAGGNDENAGELNPSHFPRQARGKLLSYPFLVLAVKTRNYLLPPHGEMLL